jgi:hypothetical protein
MALGYRPCRERSFDDRVCGGGESVGGGLREHLGRSSRAHVVNV